VKRIIHAALFVDVIFIGLQQVFPASISTKFIEMCKVHKRFDKGRTVYDM